MRLFGKEKLLKYSKKDKQLLGKINEFVIKFEKAQWKTSQDIKDTFHDVDLISKDAYIFNIQSSRTLIVIFFDLDEADIAWAGNHDDYERKFSSKKSILKYLKEQGFIDNP